jgi:hypothetical protein
MFDLFDCDAVEGWLCRFKTAKILNGQVNKYITDPVLNR